MAMRCLVANARKLWLASAIAFVCVFGSAPAAQATNTSVETTVCGGSTTDALQLSIAQPKSDVVLSEPLVTVRGSVNNAAQIVVTINDGFHSIIPLGASQVAFVYDIAIEQGTHTIALKAIGICGGEVSDKVVVTYQVKGQASQGTNVPTDLDNNQAGHGSDAAANREFNAEQTDSGSFRLTDIPSYLFSETWDALRNNAGIDSTVTNAPLKGVVRVVAVVAAASLLVGAGLLVPYVTSLFPNVAAFIRQHRHIGLLLVVMAIRLLAVPLLAVAYFV